MAKIDFAEIWSNFLKNKGEWKIGVYSGIFFTIAILLLVGYGEINIPLKWNSNSWDVQPTGKVLGLPNYENPTIFSLTINGIIGECLDLVIKEGNGHSTNGRFCKGEKVIINDYFLEITDIKINSDLPKPIKISTYKMFNLGGILKILLVVIPLIAIWDRISRLKEDKARREIEEKRRKIRRKLKLSEKDFEELEDILFEEN